MNSTLIYAVLATVAVIDVAAHNEIEIVCNGIDGAGYRERAMATQRLGTSLGGVEIGMLCNFLSSRVSAHHELTTNELASLKNDVLNALIAQERLPDNLGQVILANYTNTQQDVVWRAFCLQHFYQYYRRRWIYPPLRVGASNEFDALHIERAAIKSNLWRAASGTNDEFCCIALSVLDGIIMSNSTVTTSSVSAAAAMVAKTRTGEMACGRMRLRSPRGTRTRTCLQRRGSARSPRTRRCFSRRRSAHWD